MTWKNVGESLTIFAGYLTTAPFELKNTFANQSGLKRDINFYGEYAKNKKQKKNIMLNEEYSLEHIHKYAYSTKFSDDFIHFKQRNQIQKIYSQYFQDNQIYTKIEF